MRGEEKKLDPPIEAEVARAFLDEPEQPPPRRCLVKAKPGNGSRIDSFRNTSEEATRFRMPSGIRAARPRTPP
jgi:hypothetical protein